MCGRVLASLPSARYGLKSSVVSILLPSELGLPSFLKVGGLRFAILVGTWEGLEQAGCSALGESRGSGIKRKTIGCQRTLFEAGTERPIFGCRVEDILVPVRFVPVLAIRRYELLRGATEMR